MAVVDEGAADDDDEGGRLIDLDIALLTPGEWDVLQDVRMKALADAADAFLTSGEGAWSPADWRRAVLSARWGVARAGDAVIGLACSKAEHDDSVVRHLQSVWVHPGFRKQRVATTLLQWLIGYEREDGARDIRVWVIQTNDVALRLYERLGFRATQEIQNIQGDDRKEIRLRLDDEGLQ